MRLSWLQVSLFAEQFNEMLLRDFGVCIYKSLLGCPEKVQEDEKQKASESKKRDDKDKRDRDGVDVKDEHAEAVDVTHTANVCMILHCHSLT